MNEQQQQAISAVLNGLVAQNLELGQKILGLQAVCSKLLAEVCLLHQDPEDKMMRLSAELNGAACAIADTFRKTSQTADYDREYITQGVTSAVEAVTLIAEEAVQQSCLRNTR